MIQMDNRIVYCNCLDISLYLSRSSIRSKDVYLIYESYMNHIVVFNMFIVIYNKSIYLNG